MTFAPSWFLKLFESAPNWAESLSPFEESDVTGAIDAATLAEYLAASGSSNRAQAVLDALDDPVTVRVYDGAGNIKGQGTMQTPWATRSGAVLTLAELTGFEVTSSGTPDAGWYLRFESGTRWVRGSFGLVGSGAACTWSLPTWQVGQFGTLGTVTIGAPSSSAPSLVGAPSTLVFSQGVGGTYDFGADAVDPDGEAMTLALVGTAYTGITMNSAGVLTVSAAATSAVRDLTIRVTDTTGQSADHVCAVSVFGWLSAGAINIGTLTAGATYNAAQHANTVGGTPQYSVVSGPATVDASSGLLTINPGTGAGAASVVLSLSNGGINPATATLDMAIAAVGDWQLAAGHYIPAKMAPTIIHPRPMAETLAWERHRRAPSGIPWRCPIVVRGGSWPFRYTLIDGPSGMEIGRTLPLDWLTNGLGDYGVLTWESPTVGTYSITVRVECQDGSNPADLTWTLEIGNREDTAFFLFVNAAAAGGGSGSYSSPFNSIAQWYGSARNSTEYSGRQVFYYAGTYTFPSLALQTNATFDFKTAKPFVHVALPGESVTWDMQSSGSLDVNGGTLAGLWVSGIRHINPRHLNGGTPRKQVWRMSGPTVRCVWYGNQFDGGGAISSTDGSNSSALFFASSSAGSDNRYNAIVGNDFYRCDDMDTVLCYNSFDHVFEGNVITGGYGTVANGGWGYFIKGGFSTPSNQRHTIRANRGVQSGNTRPLAFCSAFTAQIKGDIEVCWNSYVSAGTGTAEGVGAGAFGIGQSPAETNYGAFWSYRNSWRVPFHTLYGLDAGGPFTFQNEAVQHNGSHANGYQILSCAVTPTLDVLAEATGLLDPTTNLLTPAYAANRGTHGCEVA